MTILDSPTSGRLTDKNHLPTPTASRILVAEDSELLRELALRILKSGGYHEVHTAIDGEDAWEKICTEQFDLLITDHTMPRLTGAGLVERVRTARIPLPVIMASGT